LIKTFKPRLHLHGHVHLYTPIKPWKTRFHQTLVVNAYGFREIPWPLPKDW
jgi:Icc-related predicted phosphoesterase